MYIMEVLLMLIMIFFAYVREILVDTILYQTCVLFSNRNSIYQDPVEPINSNRILTNLNSFLFIFSKLQRF
jgi:hypothetical protein